MERTLGILWLSTATILWSCDPLKNPSSPWRHSNLAYSQLLYPTKIHYSPKSDGNDHIWGTPSYSWWPKVFLLLRSLLLTSPEIHSSFTQQTAHSFTAEKYIGRLVLWSPHSHMNRSHTGSILVYCTTWPRLTRKWETITLLQRTTTAVRWSTESTARVKIREIQALVTFLPKW